MYQISLTESSIKSSEKGAPAERANGNKSLTGAWREPHRFHQAEVEQAQRKATHHVSQVVSSQQHPGHAHQESPQHQQDAERHSQDQVGQQELGDHNGAAGVSGGEGVDVHGDAVQEAWRHLPGSPALHQSLDSSHSHDVKKEGCDWERQGPLLKTGTNTIEVNRSFISKVDLNY